MATRRGFIKKTALSEFQNVRRSGIVAIKLKSGDLLKWVKISGGEDEIIFITARGQSIRFKEKQARPMGRAAAGVTAIKMKKDDFLSALDIIKKEAKTAKLLVVMENGFGKQTVLSQYKIQNRGGSGIKTAKITKKNRPGRRRESHRFRERASGSFRQRPDYPHRAFRNPFGRARHPRGSRDESQDGRQSGGDYRVIKNFNPIFK